MIGVPVPKYFSKRYALELVGSKTQENKEHSLPGPLHTNDGTDRLNYGIDLKNFGLIPEGARIMQK